MTIFAILLLMGTLWALWNMHQNIQRLDDLIDQWSETLTQLNASADDTDSPTSAGTANDDLQVIIKINDAVGLAKRYHWAGSAGALAPNVLKKTMQTRVLEQTQAAMQEGGHEADVKVIVL